MLFFAVFCDVANITRYDGISKGGDDMTGKTTRDQLLDAILDELSEIFDLWLLRQILDMLRNVRNR